MDEEVTIDEAIDTSLDLLESDSAVGRVEKVVTWVVDNLICELDVLECGALSRCTVSGYDVCRVGAQLGVIVMTPRAELMDSQAARRLAVALLRAAEAADKETA